MAKAKESKHFRFKRVEFWACNGRVYVMDLDAAANTDADLDEQIQTISPGDLMKRAIAIRQMTGDKYPDEVKAARDLLDNAMVVAKAAKFQGDPTDPKVLEHHGKHGRRSQILVPGQNDPNHGKIWTGVPEPTYKIPKRDVRDIMLRGVQVTPDLAVSPTEAVTPERAQLMRKTRT